MKRKILIIAVGILILSCSKRSYYQEDTHNPVYNSNKVFSSFEDLTSPKFKQIIKKYQLDTVFHGETNEFKRILLLRNWIKSKIKIDDYCNSYPAGKGDAEGILDEALKGQGFDCGYFMTVQNAVMNSFGYVTRTLGAGPGVEGGPDGHHGINEIWSNDYQKWILSDAKYNHHFEKDGIPLSVLEIRDEYLKNKAEDIVFAIGTTRIHTNFDKVEDISKEEFAQIYTFVGWHGYNNAFTAWPEDNGTTVMYNDDFYRNNTWIRNGKPHWTYNHPEYLKLTEDRNAIEWTPNTIGSKVQINRSEAIVELVTDTPNFKEFQMKDSNSEVWIKVENSIILELKENMHEFNFRIVNLAGVTGLIHKIIINSK